MSARTKHFIHETSSDFFPFASSPHPRLSPVLIVDDLTFERPKNQQQIHSELIFILLRVCVSICAIRVYACLFFSSMLCLLLTEFDDSLLQIQSICSVKRRFRLTVKTENYGEDKIVFTVTAMGLGLLNFKRFAHCNKFPFVKFTMKSEKFFHFSAHKIS